MASSSVRSAPAILLARTPQGAEPLARFVDGDAVCVVGAASDHPALDQLDGGGHSQVVVGFDGSDPGWLRDALEVARSKTAPGGRITLVMPPSGDLGSTTTAIAEALGGWSVHAAAVEGDVVAIHLAATNESIGHAQTINSIEGALALASMLHTLADPESVDVGEFAYRTSLTTSYLRDIPRLHTDLDEARRQLEELRQSASSTTVGGTAATAASPAPASTTVPSGRLPRRRQLALLAMLGLAGWTVASVGLTAVFDIGGTGFLCFVIVGLLIASVVDNRRRAVRIHTRLQQVQTNFDARIAQATYRTHTLINKRYDQSATALRESGQRLEQRLEQCEEHTRTDLSKGADRLHHDVTGSAAMTTETLSRHITAGLATTYRQLEGLHLLRDTVSVRGPTPPLRGWAASPDVLAFLVAELRRSRPSVVVECGSGASTVWLSMAVRDLRLDTRIVALEHDEHFAAETRRQLVENDVDGVGEVRVAELVPVTIGDFTGKWYATGAIRDLENVGLVFVDGPPADTGEGARYPALPLLAGHLAATATVVLDDTIRQDERDIARRWSTEFPDLTLEFVPFEKGAAVLRRTPGSNRPAPSEPQD